MAKRRTRAQSAAATREALIAAGLAEFSGRGFAASLDDICARAKLTRGAFYVHFADRDAFIVAVMEHVLNSFVATVTAVPVAGLDRIIDLYFAATRTRAPAVAGGSALRLQHLMEACRRSPQIARSYRTLLLAARDRLAATIAADPAVRGDVAGLADLLLVLALGVAATLELEVPIDVPALGDTVRGVVAS